jgi:hypothetical protein
MIYSAIGETTDGVVHLGLMGGGMVRVASMTRRCVAAIGRVGVYELDLTTTAEAVPSSARVVGIDRRGWAVAIEPVPPMLPAGVLDYRLELWSYEAGTWALAAEGQSDTAVAGFDVVIVDDDLWLVSPLGECQVRRGGSLVVDENPPPRVAGLAAAGATTAVWWQGEWTVCPEIYEEGRAVGFSPSAGGLCGTAPVYVGAAAGPAWCLWTSSGWRLQAIPYDPGYVALTVFLLQTGASGDCWFLSDVGPAYVIAATAGGLLIWAEERDGVSGLVVSGASDPSADGWYVPGDEVNGQPSWVSEDGDWWIIWDGDEWILAPNGETEGGYSTTPEGSNLGVVVTDAPDASCNGDYLPDGTENGRTAYDQVDGDHRIIWDGEQWVLVDGEGTVIYVDGSGPEPWMGTWTDPAGGAGPTVSGRMSETEAMVTPGAGEHVRFMSETSATERAIAAQLLVTGDLTGVRALVRTDSTADRDDWMSYRVMPLSPAQVHLDPPATTVEVAIIKPTATAEPDVRLATRRFPE